MFKPLVVVDVEKDLRQKQDSNQCLPPWGRTHYHLADEAVVTEENHSVLLHAVQSGSRYCLHTPLGIVCTHR